MLERFIRLVSHQNWIRRGIRGRLNNLWYSNFCRNNGDFEVNYFNLKYKGNLNSYIDRDVYFYGAYEREYLDMLEKTVTDKENGMFLDIGANVGLHSLCMARFFKQVHAFEPNQAVYQKFKENIQLNQLSNITLHTIGLGQKDEQLPFYQPEGENLGTGSFVEGFSDNNKKQLSLQIKHADPYLSENEIKNIKLIKIDVEGYELEVLRGLYETLNQFRPVVGIEYSGLTAQKIKSLKQFREYLPDGYQVKYMKCNTPRFLLFNNPACELIDFDFKSSGLNLVLIP